MDHLTKVTIITIGDELLIGQVIDTNSAWMAERLNNEGLWVNKKLAVGDNREDVLKALDEESRDADIILITGGLGPTADDITKPLLAEYFGGRLVTNQDVLNHIRFLFEEVYRRPFTERNAKQAEVPDNCKVIHNDRGTAPGMWFEKDGKIFVSMPGVPNEMKGMMREYVLPKLRERFGGTHILHRTLLTAGIGESNLADHIQSWEEKLPASIKLAYLPNYGLVRLRLTASGRDRKVLEDEIDHQFGLLKTLVEQWLVTDEDQTLVQVIASLLKSKNKSLGLAESCTGGYIAHLFTREPGASAFLKGGIVSYANEIKESSLQVEHNTLVNFGAVSEETVREMATGALKALKADYSIATSGIMGPDGGTSSKPVGTVWMAAAGKDRIKTRHFHLRYDRNRNIEMTASYALDLLRRLILESEN